jgi:two-component system osmolarity sensor histidine kinase EnvZ
VVTIALTLVAFMAISMAAAVYFVYNPMAKRSADDFAAVVVAAAHSLQSLPVAMHAELKDRLMQDHGLIVAEQPFESLETTSDLPFYPFFHEALDARAGKDLRIVESHASPIIWVDVPAHGVIYRLGFDKERLGINSPVVLILTVGVGALLTLLASVLEVRRVVRPLNRLSDAVKKLGRGGNPPSISEEGPEEIASLARTFNRMSADLQQLSENRTVMIAGISHDLRTPLTRLGLAVEMLDQDSNPELVERIRHNLETMNSLIRQFLQFSRGVEGDLPVQLDLWQMIESLALEGSELRLHRKDPPCVYFADAAALERVLANLLKNAAQHGNGKPIDVELHCSDEEVAIEIADRGPGIPAEEVQCSGRSTASSRRMGKRPGARGSALPSQTSWSSNTTGRFSCFLGKAAARSRSSPCRPDSASGFAGLQRSDGRYRLICNPAPQSAPLSVNPLKTKAWRRQSALTRFDRKILSSCVGSAPIDDSR